MNTKTIPKARCFNIKTVIARTPTDMSENEAI